MRRLLLLATALLVLHACADAPRDGPAAPPARAAAASIDSLLAPFEEVEALPAVVAALPFREGGSYAILVQLPAPAVVDLSDPNRARDAMRRFLDPFAAARAGTRIGHAMVGWRCADGHAGLAGMTGASGLIGLRMLLAGWGVATLLSDYADGELVPLAGITAANRRALAAGQGRVVAFEIGAPDCRRMRAALAAEIAGRAAARRYSMVPDRGGDNDGCGSFALWLAGQGGVFRGAEAAFRRELVLRDSFIGRGRPVAGPVRPFSPRAAACDCPPITPGALFAADWTQGREVGRVTLMDMELLLRALELAHARAGQEYPPRLDPAEPGMAALERAVGRWLARYRRATPVRVGVAQAVVLHWR